jgi:hypothetical protein
MKKAMEANTISTLDPETILRELTDAPAAEILTRARSCLDKVSLTNSRPPKIMLGGFKFRINAWSPLFKLRRDDLIAELLTESEEERLAELIIGDIGACESCGHVLVPPPDAQVENVRLEQLRQSPYWQWTIDELARLKNHLEPGDLIVQRFAHSVTIRNAAGQLRNWPKSES